MSVILPLPPVASLTPDQERPDPALILDGDPRQTTWLTYHSADGRRLAGEWACEPGSWRIDYQEWEWIEMISGRCHLVAEDGTRQDFGPGDSFVIEPGYKGVWTVTEAMRKRFVILQP